MRAPTSDDFPEDPRPPRAWDALGDRLRTGLDRETGLADVLRHDGYRRLERRIAAGLDVEGGLRAASAAGAARPPARHRDDPRLGGSTALRIVVGAQLRRWREAAGITWGVAGKAIRASHAKIRLLEMGRTGLAERDVEVLLALYGVGGREERDQFLAHVRDANSRRWWQRYGGALPTWQELYVGLEQASSVIRTFQVQLVPGLLQDSEYARTVLRARGGHESEDHIDWRVQLLMERQKMLTEPGAPRFWAVIDESVISRGFGTGHVMAVQLEHLLVMSELPNVTVQVLPFHLGGPAAAGGAFTILRFAEPELSDVVYLEQLNSAVYLDRSAEVEDYRAMMDRMGVLAVPPRDSRDRLRRALREL